MNLSDPHTLRVIIVLAFLAGIVVGVMAGFFVCSIWAAECCAECAEERMNQ